VGKSGRRHDAHNGFKIPGLSGVQAPMTNRRVFLQLTSGLSLAQPGAEAADADRQYWLRLMTRVAEPVLTNLAGGTLKRRMPVESTTGDLSERRKYTHLEAIARLLSGIAPWLEVALEKGPERDLQHSYATLARKAIHSATDPSSPDFLNFHEGQQPLVDCGFLSQAILRAPNELWKKLDAVTRKYVVDALKSSRAITPGPNNWLLFSATVEAALALMGEPADHMRIDYAVRQHQQWYVGDGVYGDGPRFHWDYYNSFVIQPMLLDVLRTMSARERTWQTMYPDILARAKRYAAIQERLISPEGTIPVIGRSICYRTGALQLLAQIALLGELPPPLRPASVRAALTAVMRRLFEAPATFDADGWLTVGLCGHQPRLAETYISTGSLYLCAGIFLPLGLAPSDPFWSGPASDWTSRRIYRGEDADADHAISV
jgi:hypothetical protein